MIVDASAMLAVLFAEPDAVRFATALRTASRKAMSALNWFETVIAIDRRGTHEQGTEFETLLRRLGIEIVPFDAGQATMARRAYQIWGKGRHKASLNMGDCVAYALARLRQDTLLFKGGDFALTDIEPALKD
jgi:ribonuclease VapC